VVRSGHGLIEALSRFFPEGSEKYNEMSES
jgi:hypothetical protein